MTSIPKLKHRVKKAKEEGTEPEDLVIDSNFPVFKDERFEELIVCYKQNILNWAKARELGKICNVLNDKALFVAPSHGKQVGASNDV